MKTFMIDGVEYVDRQEAAHAMAEDYALIIGQEWTLIRANIERAFAEQPDTLAAALRVLEEQKALADKSAARAIDRLRYPGGTN
jgi:hypothetical protein